MQLSSTVPVTAPPTEKRLAAALQHRFFLRLHMAAILTGTILVGLGITRVLFLIHLDIFALRYAVAVLAAWGAFVVFVKLWLAYISMRSGGSNWLDSINFSSGGSSSSSSVSSGSSSLSGGGGKFGGGGASGSWDEPGATAAPKVAVIPAPVAQPARSGGSSKSGGGGGGIDGDDLGELILVVLIIALVVAIVLSFAWIVWAAPGILGETAFNAALAGALTPHAHKATHGNWIGSVMKKTAIPFVLIFALAIAVGGWAQHICPRARRLTDAVHCMR
ncbi:MAG TPA: hypothetical protein VL284_07780 [Thermoanaerobaculia bacterium]|nr:hypothetical protein [Thermoanaerobaculia bacterium]